jgi:glycosidase
MAGADVADWVDHVVWWQLDPLTFTGAGSAPGAGLRRLEPWLPYLVELGCNGLALGPVFASETHGYDTVDHLRVDPRLGTEQDLVALVDNCRARGVRVLLDGVFNHVGRGFGPFQDVLRRGRESRYAGWFRIDWDAGGADGFGYADFEGHRHLVALNHDEPAVADYVTEVMLHWLDRGCDGWRLDAAYAIPPGFLRTVLGRVRARHPETWFVGEVIHGDYPALVRDAGLDAVTQYELWKATWSSLNDRNLFELAWALDRHRGFAEAFTPLVFVGNHDVTRIASRLTDAEHHLPHALAVLFTAPGVPSVYAGDEQGMRGVKYEREGGDDEIRPAFPAGPDALPAQGRPVHRLHQELIGLRRRHPWLVRATVHEPVHLANEQLAYRLTGRTTGPPAERQGLTVALNLADRPARYELPAPGRTPSRPVAGAAEVGRSAGGDVEIVDLPAHGWVVLGAG